MVCTPLILYAVLSSWLPVEFYTAAQQEALEQAYRLLGEHFDGSVIAVSGDVNVEGKENDAVRVFWSGGYVSAVGLAQLALQGILKNEPTGDQAPDDAD